MLARQVVRLAPKGRSISSLVNKPSHVPADQVLFKTVKRATYEKRDSDNVLNVLLYGTLAVGFVQIIRGELNMASGTGKKE